MTEGLWLRTLPSLSNLNNRKVIFMGFIGGANGKEPACQCRGLKRCGFKLWVGKIPGGGHAYPLHYSCLEGPMDRGTWQATVHRIAKSQTWLKWQHALTILMCFAPSKSFQFSGKLCHASQGPQLFSLSIETSLLPTSPNKFQSGTLMEQTSLNPWLLK